MTAQKKPYVNIDILEVDDMVFNRRHHAFKLTFTRYSHGRPTRYSTVYSLREVKDMLYGMREQGRINVNTRIKCVFANDDVVPLETDADWVMALLTYSEPQNG